MEEDCRQDNQANNKEASEAAFGSLFCIRHSNTMRRQCQFTVKWGKRRNIVTSGPICASALIEEADKRRRPCTKRFRLVLRWLTYRLPVLDGVNKETEELARKHCK